MIKRVSLFFAMNLEYFFSEIESIILAFEFQCFCKEWVSAVKHCYFSIVFVFYFLKNLFPVGSTSLGLRSQPSSYISVFLLTYYKLLVNNQYFRIRAILHKGISQSYLSMQDFDCSMECKCSQGCSFECRS